VPALFEAARQRFLAALRDPVSAQQALLADILRRHAGTAIGQSLGFASIEDLATYRARVPVMTYKDVERDIARMLDGEPDVLVTGQPIFFAQSTGTTGQPKRIGFHAYNTQAYLDYFGPSVASLERAFPGSLDDAIYLLAQYREDETARGIPIGQASGFLRHTFGETFARIPAAVYESKDYDARYYALLWLALADPVVCLTAMYPTVLLNLFDRATDLVRELAEDLRGGTLASGPGDLAPLAAACGARLRPRPAQAQRLLDVVRVHGAFVPEAYWPELRVIQVWKGGSAKHYLAELARRCPNTAIYPTPSGSTEACLLVGLDAAWSGGVPAILSTVFEFLPDGSLPAADNFVPITELADATDYRLVVTNDRGLYRYLMDDVFTVEARYEGAPVLAFSHRVATSSVAGEKMTEAHVLRAVEAAGRDLIAAFEVGPEVGERARYAIAVELTHPAPRDVLAGFLQQFERELRAVNISYEQYRDAGLLRGPVLYVMPPRYFETTRRDRAAQRSDAQMKAIILHTKFIDWREGAIANIDG
jgi:hypothetical protein